MKHLIKLPLIALLLSALCIMSCSLDADEIYSTNHNQDENTSDGINAISFSDFTVIGKDSLIAQVVEMPAQFVSKDEFFANYHPKKNIAETYSDDTRSPVKIKKIGSSYEVTITCENKMAVIYETNYPYEFPPEELTKYRVVYNLSPGEYVGGAKAYRESALQLSASIDIYTKAADGTLRPSHTAGFTVRIQNKIFRITDHS